jgi:hypothetical protein
MVVLFVARRSSLVVRRRSPSPLSSTHRDDTTARVIIVSVSRASARSRARESGLDEGRETKQSAFSSTKEHAGEKERKKICI